MIAANETVRLCGRSERIREIMMVRPLLRLMILFLLGFVLLTENHQAHSQVSSTAYATSFFLDNAPSAAVLSATGASDITVAKVRVRDISLLRGRHPGEFPKPIPKELYTAEVEVLDVLTGTATKGPRQFVRFGNEIPNAKYKFPHTADENARVFRCVYFPGRSTRADRFPDRSRRI
jgi:hypothetical protein